MITLYVAYLVNQRPFVTRPLIFRDMLLKGAFADSYEVCCIDRIATSKVQREKLDSWTSQYWLHSFVFVALKIFGPVKQKLASQTNSPLLYKVRQLLS